MKKFKILLLLVCSILICQRGQAQLSYKPTDKWPYAFETFQHAVMHQYTGDDIEADANVCIDDGSLHYIDGGEIKQYTGREIRDVEFGDRRYIYTLGSFMEVLAGQDGSMVLKDIHAEAAGSGGVDIGFGIVTENYAASNVDMSASAGLGSALLHTKVAEAAENAQYGAALKTVEKIYFYLDGNLIPATKKDFTESVGKQAATEFLKSNKIKWTSAKDLEVALDFLKKNMIEN